MSIAFFNHLSSRFYNTDLLKLRLKISVIDIDIDVEYRYRQWNPL